MSIVAKNNDPPLTIQPIDSTICEHDICGFSDYEEMVKAFVERSERINGGSTVIAHLLIIIIDYRS